MTLSLLSTSMLPQALIDRAGKAGISLDAFPFISIETIVDGGLAAEVAELMPLPVTAVFTSANAARALAAMALGAAPAWNVYCTGGATKDEILRCFGNCMIKGTADDAASLAQKIIADDVQEVVFFCGDKRMDTLPGLLLADDISVHEMTVYKTIETPQVAAKAYDGILFFSPSEVGSFFRVNTIGHTTVLFAIGNTTANAIKELSGNKVVVGETPSKEVLVGCAVGYFGHLGKGK